DDGQHQSVETAGTPDATSQVELPICRRRASRRGDREGLACRVRLESPEEIPFGHAEFGPWPVARVADDLSIGANQGDAGAGVRAAALLEQRLDTGVPDPEGRDLGAFGSLELVRDDRQAEVEDLERAVP